MPGWRKTKKLLSSAPKNATGGYGKPGKNKASWENPSGAIDYGKYAGMRHAGGGIVVSKAQSKEYKRRSPGGKSPGGGRGSSGGRGGGAKTSTPAVPSAYAEADLTSTSLLRAQGKAYALKRASSAGTARGGTYKPKDEGQSAVVGKGKKAGLKRGGGHKAQGIPKGYHVNASGQIVKNKGKKKK